MDKPEVEITEPVIGLRRWNIKPNGELYSPIIEELWTPGVNEAKCIKTRWWQPWHHDGPSPVDGCSCGIYAHHDGALREEIYNVWGVVRGWGNVRVHPDGWRAQKAELLAIFASKQPQGLLEKVSEQYNVPILSAPYTQTMMLEEHFGSFVPKEIRPEKIQTTKTVPMVADYILWFTVGGVMVGTIGLGAIRTWQQLQKL